jgi:hypothetical protein
MTDYKTMRVPVADWQAAKAAKRENETWGDYLRRCVEADSTGTQEGVERGVATEVEQLRDSLATIEERTGRIERTLEEVTGR